jgi:hypothetical protein
MLSVLMITWLPLILDGPPKAKPRPVAMVLSAAGNVDLKSLDGKSRPVKAGELLYPGERLAASAEGSATVSILGAGVKEAIKPGSDVTLSVEGCSPSSALSSRTQQPRAVASTMRNLRPASGDGRKAGVGFRSGDDRQKAITPILGSTVVDDRPTLAWPASPSAGTYRVRLLTGAGREVWRQDVTEPRASFPTGKDPLQPATVYRWEVTDSAYHEVALGDFSVATASERAQLAELKPLADSTDPADRYAAALGYARLAAYAEALGVFERLSQEFPKEPAFADELANLRKKAGRAATEAPSAGVR